MTAIQTKVEKLEQALLSELRLPEVASSFKEYVGRVQTLEREPHRTTAPQQMVRVLKAGALFGGLLAAVSRADLVKLAESGSEDARAALRELVGACAVYPGSFDPFTVGHGDLVRRAVHLFDKVIVAVGVNPAKRPLFTAEERVKLIQEDLRDLGEKVEVIHFEGSLVSLARRLNCNVVLRGVRSVTDYLQEIQSALVNLTLSNGGVETLFLPAKEGISFVSSGVVKNVVSLEEDASSMVSPGVLAALQAKRREGKL